MVFICMFEIFGQYELNRTKYKVPHDGYEGKEVSNRLSQSPMILISPCQHNTLLSNFKTRHIAEHRHRLL